MSTPARKGGGDVWEADVLEQLLVDRIDVLDRGVELERQVLRTVVLNHETPGRLLAEILAARLNVPCRFVCSGQTPETVPERRLHAGLQFVFDIADRRVTVHLDAFTSSSPQPQENNQ
jgi:hypothetical protein